MSLDAMPEVFAQWEDEMSSAPPQKSEYDRTPPQDLNAEMSALGGMLISKDAIADVVEEVRGPDFYRPVHETIFEAIVELYGREEPVDAISVGNELRRQGTLDKVGGSVYLTDLIAHVPTAANAGYYARIVKERASLRRLVEAGTRIVQMGYAREGGDVVDIINNAQAEIYAATQQRQTEDYRKLSDILEPTMDAIEIAGQQGSGLVGVPTGFADLDRLTGGLRGGQMVVIAARPAVGKSTFAIDFARAAAIHHKKATAVFSLEMSAEEITMRLLSAEASIPLNKLRAGDMQQHDWQKMAQVAVRLEPAPLFVDDSANLTMVEIRAKARRLKQNHNLEMVIIDYLQLMSSGKRVESRQQEVSEFSRALKLLAKELDVPVIALSQLNRNLAGRADKRPQMTDLRESGSIEQDADIVLLLHREDQFDEEVRPGEADIIVAKHRNGETRTIPVAFQGHFSRFVDMARG